MKLPNPFRPHCLVGARVPRAARSRLGSLAVAVAAGAGVTALVLTSGAARAQDAPAPGSIPAVDAWVVVHGFGEFRIRFDRDVSPNHVAHFLSLAGSGFYDGLAIHRIVPRLLVQAGAEATREGHPRAWAFSAPTYRVSVGTDSTSAAIRRGTFAMALQGGEPGTAGTEWFVALRDDADLTGLGVPIGEVIEGLNVLDKLEQASTWVDRRPLERIPFEVRLGPADLPEGTAAPAREQPRPEEPGDAGEAGNSEESE